MDVFDKVANLNDYFYYQVGRVSTNSPWLNPSYEKTKKLLNIIKNKTSILNDYKLFLVGGILYDFKTTWDVDICITGNFVNYEKLENDIHKIYDIGLNQVGILTDIIWREYPHESITYDDYINGNYFKNVYKYLKLGYFKKQINDEFSVIDFRDNVEVIKRGEYLIECNRIEYPSGDKKLINRILNNPNKVLKTYFDVNVFLETDEEYFNNNTNRI